MPRTPIPDLEPHCGSWVIVSRATGQSVFETFERRTAEAINQDRYEVLTAAQWLGRFNRAVREAGPDVHALNLSLHLAAEG